MTKNVKKMYPRANKNILQEAISYTLPKLYTGTEWYVGFYAYDPITGKLKRKKIKLNFIKSVKERREKAKVIIYRISQLLDKGWNPWIEEINGSQLMEFSVACEKFKKNQDKLFSDNCIERDSHKTFLSNLNVIVNYNVNRVIPINFIYQFNKDFINEFLDYMYLEKGVSARTRDNYLNFIRKLSGFFVEKGYINNRPDDGIKPFGKKARKKKRTIIDQEDMNRLIDHLKEENPHYLLACYLTYYCCIRPKELSYLKLKDFNLKEQTVFISEEFSKNDKNAIVTLPQDVIELMIDLQVFNSPDEYYLFSSGFKPGAKFSDRRAFREYWNEKLRPALHFPEQYVFYSLKDTGITVMLRSNIDPLTVRDQARHHSIEMTNTYAQEMGMKAQDKLKKFSMP